jgi:soluble lytic murein transglycosylase-like protein
MFSLRKLALAMALALASLPTFASDLAYLQNGFSIRHEWREQMGSVTRLYLSIGNTSYVDVPTAQIDHFERDLTPPPPAERAPGAVAPQAAPQTGASALSPVIQNPARLDDVVAAAGGRHQIDPDFINSVIHAESGFNPRAVSPKGAQGLMQLMPQTASKLGVVNAFDPASNVEGGTAYLRELLEKYNYDMIKTLAAYNAGPERVARYGGVPPYRETQTYIARIVREFNRKKLAEQKAVAAAKAASRAKPSGGASQATAKPASAAKLSQQTSH